MSITKAIVSSMNSKMIKSANLLILAELDRTTTPWTVKTTPIFVSNLIKSRAVTGNPISKDVVIKVEQKANSEELSELIKNYSVASSTTSSNKEDVLENGVTDSDSATASDTSKLLFCFSHFGVANGKRNSFLGACQLESAGEFTTTGDGSAIAKSLSLRFVDSPEEITLPARDNDTYFPNIAEGATGNWTAPLFDDLSTNDSTKFPYKAKQEKSTYLIETWLGV